MENVHVLTSIVLVTGENEELLKLSIDSIIEQTVFKEGQVEIILVNNSNSSDNIANIYLGYKEYYEKWIKYVEAFNASVPKAFNEGIKFIEGGYVNFLVAGGKHEKKVVEKIQRVFRENEGVIELVAAPIRYRGVGKEFLSSINYKANKVIDLLATPTKIQISIQNSFIKADVLREIQFNEDLAYTYEVDLAIKILNRKRKYRTMKGSALTTCYFYDDQYNNTIAPTDKKWYTELVNVFLPEIYEKTKEDGRVLDFAQITGLYLIQWRFLANQNNKNKQVLLNEDLEEFFEALKHIFKEINDAYLLNRYKYSIFKTIARLHIIWMCIKKNELDVNNLFDYVISKDDIFFRYNEEVVTSFKAYKLQINLIEYRDGMLYIHATHTGPFDLENCKLYIKLGQDKYEGVKSDKYELQKYFGKTLYKNQAYCFEIPIDKDKSRQHLCFYLQYKDKAIKLGINFVKSHARLSTDKMKTYWSFDQFIAEYHKKGILILQKSKKRILKREVRLCNNLLKGNKSEKKSAFLRIIYWMTKPYFSKQRIWLTYDKLYKGGDNGEYFARYVTQKDKSIKMYYLVAPNAPFRDKLRADGIRVVEYGSLKHRLLFLNSEIIFATHTSIYNFNGFGKHIEKYFRDLTKFHIVCIQHGLTVQKFAHSLNKDFDDTKKFYCASKYEIQDNLSKPIYGYQKKDLRLTGSPRYDGLISNDQKQILISPTWRMNIAMPSVMGQVRPYNPNFKYSKYYQVYNSIINNQQLINKAKETGYRLIYLVHPTFSNQVDDYDKNDYVEIIPASGDISYEKILTESSLLVTDYSGIQFDFAYMKKPLLYLHHKEIPAHYEEGCFYYDKMAFGDICTNSQMLIDKLCQYMDNGCRMEEKYIERVDDFFAYNDHNNAQRIYEDIIKEYGKR